MEKKLIERPFFERDTESVARELLGKILIREWRGQLLAGKIVETEAYTSQDPACHAFRGKTERTAPLFETVGHTYVYFIYGNYFCINIVARNANVPAGGVLLRALEPCLGIEIMRQLRPQGFGYNLSNGPGKLSQALGIVKDSCSRVDITKIGSLYLIDAPVAHSTEVRSGPRIGIRVGLDKQWRFWLAGNPWVSKFR